MKWGEKPRLILHQNLFTKRGGELKYVYAKRREFLNQLDSNQEQYDYVISSLESP